MITTEGAADEIKPRGVRKATLTKKAALELRLKIDCALQAEGRRRLPRSAIDFLISIQAKVTATAVRLSKKQRDRTAEILAQAFLGEPLIFVEGEAMGELAGLFPYATGDGRVSAFEENFMLNLRNRLDEKRWLGEPAIAFSRKQWRIVEEIKQKTYFGLTGEPPSIDPDGLEDPDGLPPEPDETEDDWALVRVASDEDGWASDARGMPPGSI
jgi:hypothetical protein